MYIKFLPLLNGIFRDGLVKDKHKQREITQNCK